MATHSSTLAWRIPWTEEPGGLPSMWSHRVGHNWSDLAAAAAAAAGFSNKDQSFYIKGPLYSNRTLTNYNCKTYFQIRYHSEVLGRMWIWQTHYLTLYHGVAPDWDTEEGWYLESRQTHRAGQDKRTEVNYPGKPKTVLKLGGHSGRKEGDNWCFPLTQAQAEIQTGIL